MPPTRSGSSEMVHSGYPVKQALAAAYSTARKARGYDDGGAVDPWVVGLKNIRASDFAARQAQGSDVPLPRVTVDTPYASGPSRLTGGMDIPVGGGEVGIGGRYSRWDDRSPPNVGVDLHYRRRFADGGDVGQGTVHEDHPLLNHILGVHADHFIVTPESEAAARLIMEGLDAASPEEIAAIIHKKDLNGQQLDNVFSYIPKGKKHAVLKHLDAMHGYSPEPPQAMQRGGAVLNRALSAAKKFASGGPLDETGLGTPDAHVPHLSGMLHSTVPGRVDKLPIRVESGSYVIPADSVSSLGQGNSLAGRQILDHMIASHAGQIGLPRIRRRRRAPMRAMFAEGGMETRPVNIIASGGEYIVSPEAVAAIGGGDLDKGHSALDDFVLKVRKGAIKTLKGLKPPRVD